MKKISVLAIVLSMALGACNTSNTADEKIDFTKSYESAALAMTDAQQKYDIALSTHDATKIAAAKQTLEQATEKYVASKNNYVAKGGVVNAQYEQSLNKSTHILSSPIATTTSAAAPITTGKASVDSTISHVSKRANQVQQTIQQGQNKLNETAKNIQDKKTKAEAQAKKAKENIIKTKDNAQKTIKDQAEKAKSDLNSLKDLLK